MSEHEHDHGVPPFSVSASERSPVLRSLAIEVEESGVRDAFEHVYRDLAKSVRIKGFRPGKAPRAVLERMYGPSVREEVERLLVSQTFAAAALRSGIVPVVEPDIEAEPPEPGRAFRYTAQVEVKPELELPDLDGPRPRARWCRCATTRSRASSRRCASAAPRSRTSPRRRGPARARC
jgi:trigger factor